MHRLAVAAALLAVVSPLFAATSLEGLRQSGAVLQGRLEGSRFAQAAQDTGRESNLRLTRRAADKAYRTASELAMLERTAGEVSRELDALASSPRDQARQDRVEWLLKFLADSLPPQADALSWVSGVVIHLEYEGPAAGDAEFIAAIKEMNSRVAEADEAGKKAVAAIEANEGRVKGMADLGERAKWLSARLAGYAAEYRTYSAHVREESGKLAGAFSSRS